MTDPAPSKSEMDTPERTEEACDNTKACCADAICEGKAFVRSNPFLTVLVALALGVVLGSLFTRRNTPTARERYIDEPIEDLKALARTLGERAARQAGSGGDAALGAVESLLSRIKSSLKF